VTQTIRNPPIGKPIFPRSRVPDLNAMLDGLAIEFSAQLEFGP